MEASATYKYMRISPQARLVVRLIPRQERQRGTQHSEFTKKRVTHDLEKILRSAVANAEQRQKIWTLMTWWFPGLSSTKVHGKSALRPAPNGSPLIAISGAPVRSRFGGNAGEVGQERSAVS